MTADRYLLANAAIQAGDRFAALSAMFDPVTFTHLDALGIGPGWRCWEVGAGVMSVPRWMAGKVGGTGHVLGLHRFRHLISPVRAISGDESTARDHGV